MVYTTHLWWLGGWFIIAIPEWKSKLACPLNLRGKLPLQIGLSAGTNAFFVSQQVVFTFDGSLLFLEVWYKWSLTYVLRMFRHLRFGLKFLYCTVSCRFRSTSSKNEVTYASAISSLEEHALWQLALFLLTRATNEGLSCWHRQWRKSPCLFPYDVPFTFIDSWFVTQWILGFIYGRIW